MAWSVLSAFVAYQRLTAAVMEQIRANLNHLKSPQVAISNVNVGTDFTTTSTSFTDISATYYQVTITPSISAGTCMLRVWATLPVSCSTTATAYVARFDIMVDGVSQSGGIGVAFAKGANNQIFPVNIEFLITGVTPGAKVVKLQWRTETSGSLRLYANQTSPTIVRNQFGVMEI